MGRRGPLPKPPARQAGHRKPKPAAVLELVPAQPYPLPPVKLSAAATAAWKAYWRSDVARVASEVDLPVIGRLFVMYDQYEQAIEVVNKALVVKGSTGQIRVNPIADYAYKLAGQILRLEEELGLTPLSRQRLGIAVAEKYRSLDDLNRSLSTHDVEDNGEDPRLALA